MGLDNTPSCNQAFNASVNITNPGFDGNLCNTFKCQAANDPAFEGMTPKQAIEARSSLSGIANNNSTSFGPNAGFAAKLLANIDATTMPPTTPSAPSYKQEQTLKA